MIVELMLFSGTFKLVMLTKSHLKKGYWGDEHARSFSRLFPGHVDNYGISRVLSSIGRGSQGYVAIFVFVNASQAVKEKFIIFPSMTSSVDYLFSFPNLTLPYS